MLKMSINPEIVFEGPTMGTRWNVRIAGGARDDVPALQTALQAAVQEVDAQMSTWRDDSDLMRFNAAPTGVWVALPRALIHVLGAGIAISNATGGAFEMNIGDAVRAWGFNADQADLAAIKTASANARPRASEALRLEAGLGRAMKTAPLALDLSGIAKGFGVDRLAVVLGGLGIKNALCAIDGELRALGHQASGAPWPVAIEGPDFEAIDGDRDGMARQNSVLELAEGAVATSGDYRHFVTVKGQRLSHTFDPRSGAPLIGAPASVTVLAPTCVQADAMATALMVMGPKTGLDYARQNGISALFVIRDAGALKTLGTGHFAG